VDIMLQDTTLEKRKLFDYKWWGGVVGAISTFYEVHVRGSVLLVCLRTLNLYEIRTKQSATECACVAFITPKDHYSLVSRGRIMFQSHWVCNVH